VASVRRVIPRSDQCLDAVGTRAFACRLVLLVRGSLQLRFGQRCRELLRFPKLGCSASYISRAGESVATRADQARVRI
jgi:hypothetical protein